jgi:uncharacterized protein (DUF3820 family)
METKDIKLTFGKYAGKSLSQTPTEYQTWLRGQVWFRVKFMNSGESLDDGIPFENRLSQRGLDILREVIKR